MPMFLRVSFRIAKTIILIPFVVGVVLFCLAIVLILGLIHAAFI